MKLKHHLLATGVLLGGMFAAGITYAEQTYDVALSVSAYPATSTSLPYIVGINRGVFEKEGINVVRISGSGGGGQTVRNVLSGDMAFGDVAVPAATAAFLKGEKLSIIGGATRSVSDMYFVAKKGSPITTMDHLKGKSVGYTSPGSTTQAVLELSLMKAGIDLDEVTTRSLGGINENVSALLADGVDVAVMMEPNFSQRPDPFQIVFRAEDYYPRFQQTVIISRDEYLAENPEVAERFLAAYQAAVDYVIANPEESAKAWAEETGLDLDVVRPVVARYVDSEPWSAQLDEESLGAARSAMHLSGLLKDDTDFNWSEFINQDYLPPSIPKLDLATFAD